MVVFQQVVAAALERCKVNADRIQCKLSANLVTTRRILQQLQHGYDGVKWVNPMSSSRGKSLNN